MAAIAPIRSAILRLDSAGSTFTSSHLIFARLCLEARAFAAAMPVLGNNLFYFPPTTNRAGEDNMFPFLCSNHSSSSTFITPDSGLSAKLDYHDHLQYFLFGAMIYMGLKQWKRALLFLETVLVTPVTNNASKIQVEAYRKWVLVNLLYRGVVRIFVTPTARLMVLTLYARFRGYQKRQTCKLPSNIVHLEDLTMH